MPLSAGTRLGPYEILAPLGAGGMGEVYRARDRKLDRDVAIKVVPAALAADPERVARFEREAKMLAALNHPHIAQVYGFEEGPAAFDGVGVETAAHCGWLVMELVDGPTLAERIAHGGVPITEALPIARQIAEALDYAHEHGVMHRDLKPANIKLTADGAVKVLDFGLAKALDPAPGQAPSPKPQAPDATQSPTITSPAMTRAGVILGTAAYMSPEQATGKAVDKRADIWAFGCVVYELLTGRRAFAGDEVTELVVAVMTKEPDWTALPPATPTRIVELLKRCVRKDGRERLRDIGDARTDIAEAIARGSSESAAAESTKSPARGTGATRRGTLALATLAAVMASAGTAGLILSGAWPDSRPPDARPLRLSIVHPEGSDVSAPAISPDGTRVAYAARRADGMPLLWVRDLASGETRSLVGTEGASVPFWSPDSRDLGFGAGGFVKRVPADGGPIQVVTKKAAVYGGAWAVDGTIVVNHGDLSPLFRVSATGGSATALTTLPGKDWSHYWPSFLPDGRRFFFTAKLWTRAAEASEQGIFLGSLDDAEVRRLLPDLSSAVYANGAIVLVRNGALAAAPFDLTAGRVTGPPVPIGETVAVDDYSYASGLSAASTGTLAVRPPPTVALVGGVGSGRFDAELHFVDRAGMDTRVAPAQRLSDHMALHPDGRRLALAITDPRAGTQDLSLLDLENGASTPLTTTRGFATLPVWSHDGARVAYAVQPPGQLDDVYIKDLRTGHVAPLMESPAYEDPIAWSHDSASLLVYKWDPENVDPHLWSWSFKTRTLSRFADSPAWAPAFFSPGDDYVAFTAPESGREEVFVTTFPDRRQTWPLTTEGGRALSWRSDGREILVATLSGHIVAYPVSTKDGFTAGQSTVLVRHVGYGAQFSTATRDHSRILIRVSPDAAKDKGEIRLLFGWADAWRQALKQPQ